MSCIINASTTSGLVMTSDLSGVLQLQNNGVNLPPLTVAPAFSAYAGTTVSMTGNVWTKLPVNTEEFDTNSNYDITNYRFLPTVSGYYQINAAYSNNYSAGANNSFIAIYKNGSNYKYGNLMTTATGVGGICVVSTLVYFNGSTDYVELYALSSNTATSNSGSTTTYFNGAMVRSA